MYTDKPQPGKGYIVFLLLVLIGVFCIYPVVFVFSYLRAEEASRSTLLFEGFVIALPCVVIGIVMLVGLYAAYHTEYTLRENVLELKGGGVLRRKVALHQIVEAKKVPYNARLLGSGMGVGGVRSMGVCNRFRNGVLLITRMEHIYLSPSDPDTFLEMLSALQK